MSTTTVLTSPHQPGDAYFTGDFAAALAANGGSPSQATLRHAPSPTWPVEVSGTYSVVSATAQQLQGCFLLSGTDAPYQVGDTAEISGLAPQPDGSGGTPGGSSGQIQFNNADAFGGFTASGDATINTSTGAVSVTRTGGTAFAPSATTDTTNAANIASGTLAAARLPAGTPTVLFSCLSCTPVADTATSTSVFGSPTNPSGSLTIPTSKLAPGSVLKWDLVAQYSCTGSAPSIVASVSLGGSPVLASTVPTGLGAAATNQLAVSRFNVLSILSTGADATASGWGDLALVQSASGQVGVNAVPGGSSPSATATFNGAEPVLFDFAVAWSEADPGNSFQILSFSLFLE
jgi:hypothetical protein